MNKLKKSRKDESWGKRHKGMMLAGSVVIIVVMLTGFGVGLMSVTSWPTTHGWRIAFIVVLSMAAILVVAQFVPKLMHSAVSRRVSKAEEEISKGTDRLSKVLVIVTETIVLFAGVFMILSELEMDTPILVGISIASVAFILGAQSLIKDVLGGLFIIFEHQYRVGDVVGISGLAGLVEDINFKRTILRDLDGIVHVVPNRKVQVVSNFSKSWARINLNVSVTHSEDIDRINSVINRVGKELAEDPEWAPFILNSPQVLRVDQSSSCVDVKILGDTKPIHQWDVMGELRNRLKKAFDDEGIEIGRPYIKV